MPWPMTRVRFHFMYCKFDEMNEMLRVFGHAPPTFKPTCVDRLGVARRTPNTCGMVTTADGGSSQPV